ncbi:MAG: biotin--[acetyl-CoA-carboxylase] ligase [Candidatus Promineifilaceae bacterium]|nr:biotin--[acetyl-CoA-carboxylase] ligase [Anaerolineaceae bacterium]
MDRLSATAVSQTVTTHWLGQTCQVFAELDSTNDLLKAMVRQGTPDQPPAGHLLLTEYQRRGRGRLDRRWEAPPGSSLLLSLLFRPHWPAEQANWLTMLVSTAAAEAIAGQTGLAVRLKWPNDIVVQQAGGWHKVSGILQEGGFGPDGRLHWAIVGIGINVNIPAAQLPTGVTPATSLLVATGQPVPRLPLLAAFLQRVEALYDGVGNGRSPHHRWQNKLITLGQPVHVTQPQTGHSFSGMAEATDPAGHLLVRDEAGQLHTVTAADVTLRQI